MAKDEASSPPTIFPGEGSSKEVYSGGFCFRFDRAFSGKGVMTFYPKFLYFVLFASLASAVPFLALFWEAKGLDKWQIGLIAGVRPFISFVTAPLWGFLADRTQQHKPLMALSCLLAAFMMLLLWEAEGFVGITLVMVLLAATEAPVGPLLDNTVLLWLHSSGGGKENYGRERLWGAISWGLLALIMGYVLSIASTWFWGLAVYAIGMLLFVLALWLSRISFPEVQALPAWREVRVLLANGRVVSFFFTIFIMGMGFCIISSFLFLFLREIGGSELLMGLSLVFTVATEIPFFFYAGWALRRFGVHALLVTAMLAYLLRLLAYSYLNHAWLVCIHVPPSVLFIVLLYSCSCSSCSSCSSSCSCCSCCCHFLCYFSLAFPSHP
ncbi:Major facilitator superfamily domain-containing protein 6 [Balamuthia mandrillaris]